MNTEHGNANTLGTCGTGWLGGDGKRTRTRDRTVLRWLPGAPER